MSTVVKTTSPSSLHITPLPLSEQSIASTLLFPHVRHCTGEQQQQKHSYWNVKVSLEFCNLLHCLTYETWAVFVFSFAEPLALLCPCQNKQLCTDTESPFDTAFSLSQVSSCSRTRNKKLGLVDASPIVSLFPHLCLLLPCSDGLLKHQVEHKPNLCWGSDCGSVGDS